MKALVFVLAVALSGLASAQQGKGRPQGKQQMRQEDRQRMSEDMRQVYRDKGARPDRPDRGRPMTPEEREKLRRDIQDANRNLKR